MTNCKRTISLLLIAVMVMSVIAVPTLFDNNNVYAAKKKSTKVKVVYYANGGKFTKEKYKDKKTYTKKIKAGKKLGKAPTVTREGFTFLGWYTKKTKGKKVSSKTKIKSSKKYYAHWIEQYKFHEPYFDVVENGTIKSSSGVYTYRSLDEVESIVGELTPMPATLFNTGFNYVDKKGTEFAIDVHENGECRVHGLRTRARLLINVRACDIKTFMNKLGIKKYENLRKADNQLRLYAHGQHWSLFLGSSKKIKTETIVVIGSNINGHQPKP